MIPIAAIDDFLKLFNSVHTKLQFTIKVEGDKINFLDIIILIKQSDI